MSKKLYRSRCERMLAGVCGGIAQYLDIDPSVIRLVWILLAFTGGAGLIAYIVAALVIPSEPRGGFNE